jgi:cytochrome P450
MGGKRVCLGKTFAEVTTKFTVPLLFHFFDFEFTKPE